MFASMVALGAALALGPAPVSAKTKFAEPDNFTAGSVITNSVFGVRLSVEGDPQKSVQVLDGFSAFNGANWSDR